MSASFDGDRGAVDEEGFVAVPEGIVVGNGRLRAWLLGVPFLLVAAAIFGAFRDGGPMAAAAALMVVLLGAEAVTMALRIEARAAARLDAVVETARDRLAAADVRAETAVDEARWMRAFLDQLPAGCFAADGEGRFEYLNRTLARWLDATAADLLDDGARAGDVIAPRDDDDRAAPAFDPGREAGALAVTLRRGAGEVQGVLGQTIVHDPDGAAHSRAVVMRATPEPVSRNALRESERRFSRFFDGAPIGIGLVGLDGVVIDCNRMFRSMIGITDDDGEGRRFEDLIDARDRDEVRARLEATVASSRGQPPLDVRLVGAGETTASLFASRLEESDGTATGVILHLIDTTEQKSLELQFAQSQKMQAVGQLAGGIAHDFNNLLTAMMGFCDLLLMRHQAGDQSFADIMQIKQNVNRAAGLVRQLLAFSRRQTLQPKVLALTDVLAELSNLLRRLIGENIELRMVHSRDLGLVKVDQGQIEQVIINLAVNARDAMHDGGTLTIRTSNIYAADCAALGHDILPSADYVRIEVTDTGTGIAKEHLGKIFEPFFSTKDVGAGTGLGLSTVYGIVKQTGGFVFVKSRLGVGAAFTVYLPRHHRSADEIAASQAPVRRGPIKDLTGKGTILLVEDEDSVRTFGARALRSKGYTVLEADSAEAALDVIGFYDGAIDLLITDVVMPQMNGAVLVERVRESRPDLKVIFISGYAEDAFRKSLSRPEEIEFLPKPFSLAQLAGKVKDVIEAPLA